MKKNRFGRSISHWQEEEEEDDDDDENNEEIELKYEIQYATFNNNNNNISDISRGQVVFFCFVLLGFVYNAPLSSLSSSSSTTAT
ncbi:hypothetical protein DERF_001385 [Dermatophagoides farinae]|uniref:Uncharacterized protein n=1 Tax=Dermatophagoides farinae TaxID=6954 RepID=A0A922LCZ2_DERFA|nr:hypothetical protein DERF_001385 [Dermatophagoides farinae]